MSVFPTQGLAHPGSVDSTPGQLADLVLDSDQSMGDRTLQNEITVLRGLDPHLDARQIVRLVQCRQCSLPLRNPMTLPCGHSICRTCLPALHKRENISYPLLPSRQEGFTCPFEVCGQDHSLGDCSQDVTLSKVVDRVSIEVAGYRPKVTDTPMLLDERLRWKNIIDSSKEKDLARSRILHGGRLVATYTMAEIGELRYDSEVSYQTMSPTGDNYERLDHAFLEHLREATRNEMDCQVCYSMILDPVTTTCGHTFCRKCVARVLDHSSFCPACRRTLLMPPGAQSVPTNKRLMELMMKICPEHLAARVEAASQEEMPRGHPLPLFVCTLAYPAMPTFLHVFEPRYRLMIRRVIENGERKFGMIPHNVRGEPQGDLGVTPFMQYGTVLQIVNIQLFPDGRSIIETVGTTRFKVKDWNMHDGYCVADVERIDDMSLADEEHIEATEVSSSSPAHDLVGQLNCMSTRELLQIGTGFIARMRAASASWLQDNVLASHGTPPDDPALFPFWFATILPISMAEKYKLLPTTSVRERLKITARWVRKIEAQRWYVQHLKLALLFIMFPLFFSYVARVRLR